MDHRWGQAHLLCANTLVLLCLVAGALDADAQSRRRSGQPNAVTAVGSVEPATPDGGALPSGVRAKGLQVVTSARTRPSTGRWAILIGVGSYQDSEHFPPLRTDTMPDIPAKDVADLGTVLRASGYGVICLTGAEAALERKPTRTNILRVVRALSEPDGPYPIHQDDTVVVYYSGNGFGSPGTSDQDDGVGYIPAVDTSYEQAEQTAVRMTDLRDFLVRCPARHKVLVLDACHGGMAMGKCIEGVVLLSACGSREQSYFLEKVPGVVERSNSIYTYYLVKGLDGGADEDRNGQVTATELHRFAHRQVSRWAKELGVEQTPVLAGVLADDPVLAGAPRPATLALNSAPWAQVTVDGEAKGRTPMLLDVAPGRHTVVFHDSARPAKIVKVVDVAPGEEMPLSVVFSPK